MGMFSKKKDVLLSEKNVQHIEEEASDENLSEHRGVQVLAQSKSHEKKVCFHALRLALTLSLVLMLSIIFNFYQFTHRPTPVYFASTPDLRLAPMTPLDKPQMSQGALLDWAVETVEDTLSLDFRNYKRQLTGVRERYTPKAFKQVMASMKSSGTLRMLVEKTLSATVVLTAAPIIDKAGVLRGVYTWKIKFPLLLTYEDSNGIQNTQKLKIAVIVERAKTTDSYKGVLVKQLVTIAE